VQELGSGQEVIQVTKKKWIGIAVLCGALLLPGSAFAGDVSDLESALDHLQSARNVLERGKNKGPRKDALESIDDAIDSVRKALKKEKKKKKNK
jgi:hypothetical protein